MLNTISGGSSMPREVLQWLDGLDLSYAVRNTKMDLANGFIIAEILTRKFPNELSILTFYNAQKKEKKIDNWQQIQKCKKAYLVSIVVLTFYLFNKLYFSPCQEKIQNHQRRV
jgi:hypothetical protein